MNTAKATKKNYLSTDARQSVFKAKTVDILEKNEVNNC
jgi:hypothetical protein